MSCTTHEILEYSSLMYFRRREKTLQLLKKHKIGKRTNKRPSDWGHHVTWLKWPNLSPFRRADLCRCTFVKKIILASKPTLSQLTLKKKKRPQVLYNLPATKLRIEHGVCMAKLALLEDVRICSKRKKPIVTWIMIFLHTYETDGFLFFVS